MTKKELIKKLNILYSPSDIMFEDASRYSIAIKYNFKDNFFVKSAIIIFSGEFYRHFEENVRALGFKGKINYNNTGDIFSIWVDSNMTEYTE